MRLRVFEFLSRSNQLISVRRFFLIDFSIGEDNLDHEFTLNKIQLRKRDMIYLFTDGYADQFGGERGKKFLYNRFRQHLLSVHKKGMNEQRAYLESTMHEWQGSFEQVDDILVIGVRI